MAGTTAKITQGRNVSGPKNDIDQLRLSINALVADVELLRARLVAHTHDGVTAGGGVSGAATASSVTTVATAATMTGFALDA